MLLGRLRDVLEKTSFLRYDVRDILKTSQKRHLSWDVFETFYKRHKKVISFETFLRDLWDISINEDLIEISQRHFMPAEVSDRYFYETIQCLLFSIKYNRHCIFYIYIYVEFRRCRIPCYFTYRCADRRAKVISIDIFYFIQHSNDMVATSTSCHHARKPCGDNHTIRIRYNPHFLLVMDTYGPLITAEQGCLCTFIYFAY